MRRMIQNMPIQTAAKILLGTSLTIIGISLSTSPATADTPATTTSASASLSKFAKAGIEPKVLRMALKAYDWAKKQGRVQKQILTIVDFSKSSIQKRLWVIDLAHQKVLFSGLVAHGKNSGGLMATHFSNAPSSDQTSLGAYVTTQTYYGKHGYSLRIDGLESGLNSNAASRAVVVHSATYVTPAFIHATGQLGHSWGCFALDPQFSSEVINDIKGGSVIFPDRVKLIADLIKDHFIFNIPQFFIQRFCRVEVLFGVFYIAQHRLYLRQVKTCFGNAGQIPRFFVIVV